MNTTVDLDDLLTNKEASAILGVKPNTLEIWRHQGKGPPFIRLGDGPCAPIRYLRSVITEFCAQRTFKSTSAYSPAALTSVKRNSCRSSGASA